MIDSIKELRDKGRTVNEIAFALRTDTVTVTTALVNAGEPNPALRDLEIKKQRKRHATQEGS